MLNTLKIFFKNEDEVKTFSDIQKQKESITRLPTFQCILKEVPSGQRKMMLGGNFNLHKGNKSLERATTWINM